MNAKSQVSDALRVEVLESRFLLSGADSIASVAFGPTEFRPTDGHDLRAARIPAPLDSLLAKLAAQYGNNPTGAETPSASSLTVSEIASHADAHTRIPISDIVGRYLEAHEREVEAHVAPQIVKNELRESLPRTQPGTAPVNPASPVPPRATSESHPGKTVRVPGEATNALVALNPVREGSGFADLSNSLPASTSEFDHASLAPVDCTPPAPGGCVMPEDSDPPGWRAVLLDPFAGIPLRDAAALNLSTLGAETEAFFARLADLDPEWCVDVEWGKYICFAAGVILVGGSVYFTRTPNAHPGKSRVRVEPPEEAP